ncbi:MAG: CC0125/CC1285 family lipoprotein [Limnohabitans sp.]
MKKLFVLALVASLAACSTAYQPYSYFGGGGYKDVQLSENSFKITVEANGYTSKSQAADLALLRAADLTLEKGFKHFVIVDSADQSHGMNYTTPTTTTVNVTGNKFGATGTAQTYGGQTFYVAFPTPVLTILAFKEKPPISGMVYDAAITSRSLRRQLNIN